MIIAEGFRKGSNLKKKKKDKQKKRKGLSWQKKKKKKNQSTRAEAEQGMTMGQKAWEDWLMLRTKRNVVDAKVRELWRDYFVTILERIYR